MSGEDSKRASEALEKVSARIKELGLDGGPNDIEGLTASYDATADAVVIDAQGYKEVFPLPPDAGGEGAELWPEIEQYLRQSASMLTGRAPEGGEPEDG